MCSKWLQILLSGKKATQEMVKKEQELKTVFQKLVKVWENTEKLLKTIAHDVLFA